jgi:uncharacterized protein YegL
MALLGACNQSNFAGGGAKRGADAKPVDPKQDADSRKSERELKLACENGQSEAKLVTEVTGQISTTVRLEGEFCGLGSEASGGDLTVLFVLDYSGSMSRNDPEVGGSCGRLQAGQAILSKLEAAPELDKANVKIALQAFGTTSIGAQSPRSVADFKASLTPEIFCNSAGGETNYEAGMKQAEDLLKPLSGNKVVYFITDGTPTVSNVGVPGVFVGERQTAQEVIAESLKASKSLRDGVKDLTLNVIFLGNLNAAREIDLEGFDPEAFLADFAGSKDNLRVVASAGDLAAKIVTFDTPTAAEFSTDSVEGVLEAADFEAQTIAIESLEPVEGRPGVYAFVTESFELNGTTEEATKNVVTLTIKGADGKLHTAVAEIKFIVDESAE